MLGLVPALPRNPAVRGLQQRIVGPFLPHLAAVFLFFFGVEEQILAVACDHPLDIAALGLDDLEVAAIARFDFLHKGVCLGMEPERVDGGKAQIKPHGRRYMDHRNAGVLEAGVEYGPAGKGLAGPAQKVRGGHLL